MKYKQGSKVKLGELTVTIMCDWNEGQSFGGIGHYAIEWLDVNNKWGCGWIPVAVLDAV